MMMQVRSKFSLTRVALTWEAQVLQLTIHSNPLIWIDRLAKRKVFRCMGVANGKLSFRPSMGGTKKVIEIYCGLLCTMARNVHQLCAAVRIN